MKKIITLILPIFLMLGAVSSVKAVNISISNSNDADDVITFQVSVSDLVSNSCPTGPCYLQGFMTKSTSGPSYFGYTKNGYGDWYKYNGSPNPDEITSTFFSFTPENGSWSGTLSVKNDTADPDYTGPGDYTLRVRRYTGNSNGPTSETSNDLGVHLDFVIPTQEPTPSPTPSLISTPTPTPSPVATSTPKPSPTKAATPRPTSSGDSVVVGESDKEILGLREQLSEDENKDDGGESGGKPFPYLAVIFILVGFGLLGAGGYAIYIQKKGYTGNVERRRTRIKN